MRRVARLLLVGLLTVLTAAPALAVEPTPAPAPAVRPDDCGSSSEEAPVHIEVTTLAPRAPSSPEQPFQVAGRLTNCGEEPVEGLQVRLAVGAKLDSRSRLGRAAEEPVLGSRRLPPVAAARETLAPGQATTFDVRVLVADLALGRQNGVFPLAVQAQARYGDAFNRESVGLASTFVPWFPDGPIAPTRIAWLLPLVDEPRRGPDGVLLDDELSDLVSDDGRLQRILTTARQGSAGACDPPPATPEGFVPPAAPDPAVPPPPCRGDAVPLTYAVDPDLIHTVEAMTRPYSVLQRGDRLNRAASEDATTWLTALQELAARGDVVALPYADPDVVAMSRPESGVRDDVEQLRRLGRSVAEGLLDTELLTSVAWPPPGPIGGSLDALVGDGDDGAPPAVLLEQSALPSVAARAGRTPSARTTLSSTTGPVTALVIDEALSRLAEPDPTDASWQGARLAEQRWIAEVAVLAAERPSQSRTFLVAPRRTADLLPAVAGPVLADTGRLPWLCPVSLADAVAGTERCTGLPDTLGPAEAEDRGAPRLRERNDRALSPAYLEQLAELRRRSDQLTDEVLVASSDEAKATKARLLRARGRAASSTWRDQPADGRRMLALLETEVDGLREQVRLVSKPVTLTGSTGTMRLTVENSLDQAVNVGIRLDDTSEARLSSEDIDVRVIPPNSAIQVPVQVEARTSGRFIARARLIDVSGDPFGAPVELAVRSTRYGRVALGVTGVAAAVLLVAAGVRITRRAIGRSGG